MENERSGHEPGTDSTAWGLDRGILFGIAGAGLSVVVGIGIAWAGISGVARLVEGTRQQTAVSTPQAQPKPAPEPVSVAASAPVQPPALPSTITVAAVGDMLFGRKVAKLIAAEGGAAPLAHVAPVLASADIAIGNLEGTLAKSGSEAKWKDVTLRGDPRGVSGLQLAGFDAVSLANNHAFDYGWPAMRDTIGVLQAARIGAGGAGADYANAWKPVVLTPRGTTVAVVSVSGVVPHGFAAKGKQPGVASAGDMDAVVRAIHAAKKRYGHVIVMFHWGVEYRDEPKQAQITVGRQAVDAGADMVIGHHPHVIEPLEIYKGKLIAYSLGDFVFDHTSVKTGEAFILNAELGEGGVKGITATPVYLDESGRPSIVRGKVAQRILKRLAELSAERHTKLEIVGDVGRVAE
jgi:poly-gamma-glutamate synthesis protein (capsule biosynthesis protein)